MQQLPTKTLLLVMPRNHPIAVPLAEELRKFPYQVTLAETPEVASSCVNYHLCVVAIDKNAARDPLIDAALKPLQGRLIPLLLEPVALPPGHWSTVPVTVQPTINQTGEKLVERMKTLPDQLTPIGPKFVHYTSPRIPLPSQRYQRKRFTGGGFIVLLLIALVLLFLKEMVH